MPSGSGNLTHREGNAQGPAMIDRRRAPTVSRKIVRSRVFLRAGSRRGSNLRREPAIDM